MSRLKICINRCPSSRRSDLQTLGGIWRGENNWKHGSRIPIKLKDLLTMSTYGAIKYVEQLPRKCLWERYNKKGIYLGRIRLRHIWQEVDQAVIHRHPSLG